jgi:hypothetical protein
MDQGVQDYANVKMENATAWMVLAHVILDGKVLLTFPKFPMYTVFFLMCRSIL